MDEHDFRPLAETTAAFDHVMYSHARRNHHFPLTKEYCSDVVEGVYEGFEFKTNAILLEAYRGLMRSGVRLCMIKRLKE